MQDFKQLDQSLFNYAVFVKDDGVTFTHISNYKDEKIQTEVLNVPSFLDFQKKRDASGLNNSHTVQVFKLCRFYTKSNIKKQSVVHKPTVLF